MKHSIRTWAASLIWAAAVAAAGQGQWATSWLALGVIALAPLALVTLAALRPRRHDEISAVDAEALAWSQSGPPSPPPPKGRPIGLRQAAWAPRPASV